MRYLFTGQDAKKIDVHATEVVGMPSLVLMERAAMSAVKLLLEREQSDARFLAVCGPGNNGGDGVATARILHEMGYKAAVSFVGQPEKMSSETQKQMEIAVGCHVPVIPMSSIKDNQFDVIIDGLFGIGLTREITDVYEQIINEINDSDAIVYSLDIPSGVHAGSGEIMNVAIKADTTITFGVNKLGLILHPGCTYAGDVIIADIGFPRESLTMIKSPYYYYEPQDIRHMLPERKPRTHKGSYGHVLVVAGSETMCGAACLCAEAAYKSGAGLVRVVSPGINRDIILEKCPEALFSERDELSEVTDWADAIVIGPGLGLDKEAQEMVQYVVENSPVPTVIDGDGIKLARNVTSTLSENFVVTPHMKEMSYLTNRDISDLLKNPVSAAYDAAMDLDGIVVCKDARTVVSDGHSCYINVSGNNGMATGGSGDVLAGVVGGFLAQGMEPFDAAKLAVYLHGLAGDVMAEKLSKYSLMASDLLDGLGEVIREGTREELR